MSQFTQSIGSLSPSQQGIYVASILLSASISSLASGHVSDRISRKWGILTGGIITLIGTVTSASSPNFASLIVARLITGVGAGQAISVSTVYLVEIAPLETRGVAACLLQFYIVLGITAGYFISYGSQHIGSSVAWRLPFIIQACVATLLCVGMSFTPFSPRWLMQGGKREHARDVLKIVRDADKVEAELREIEDSLVTESRNSQATFKEVFSQRYLKRIVLGIVLMSLQQLTGVPFSFPSPLCMSCNLTSFLDRCSALLCTSSLPTSWLHNPACLFPRLWRYWHCHDHLHYTCSDMDRPLG